MKRLPTILFLCLFSTLTEAQNKSGAGFGIEANYMSGKILKHTPNFRPPIPDRTTAVELNFIQQTWGNKDWEQRRNFPLVGFGITYTHYGIDSIYGNCISIYPNLQLPIIKGKKLEWIFRAGFGLGYVTRAFERAPVWDTLNNVIGSRVNNYTIFATDIRYHVNEHLDVQLGGNFSHISNAAFRKPNLGVNFYGAHVGLRYFPVTSQPEKKVRDLPKLKNRWLAQLRFGISANEYGTGDGPLYPVYLVSAYASKRYHSKNKLLFGVDYSYHTGIYAFLRNNEINSGEEKNNSWKSSVFAGNEFLIGRLGIMLQMGYYTRRSALSQDPYYQKLGINAYLIQKEKGALKEVAGAVLLKTHKAEAELVEMGITVGF